MDNGDGVRPAVSDSTSKLISGQLMDNLYTGISLPLLDTMVPGLSLPKYVRGPLFTVIDTSTPLDH